MKFTTKNRIKVCRRLIKKYEKFHREVSLYGYGDIEKYYRLIEYWELVLLKLKAGTY